MSRIYVRLSCRTHTELPAPELVCASQGDVDDPRFAALLTRPDFAFDPTDPHFRRPGVAELAAEVAKRKKSGKARRDGQGAGSANGAEPKLPVTGKIYLAISGNACVWCLLVLPVVLQRTPY